MKLEKKKEILQLYSRAQAPSRDYCGLTIRESEICFDVWRVTRGPHYLPKQKVINVADFTNDKYLKEDIRRSFGESVHDYIVDLSNGIRKIDNLPTDIFLKIVKYLSVNDILNLAKTNKIIYELCNTDAVWEVIFPKLLRRSPSIDEQQIAQTFGWREALRRRVIDFKRASILMGSPGTSTLHVTPPKNIKQKSSPFSLIKPVPSPLNTSRAKSSTLPSTAPTPKTPSRVPSATVAKSNIGTSLGVKSGGSPTNKMASITTLRSKGSPLDIKTSKTELVTRKISLTRN